MNPSIFNFNEHGVRIVYGANGEPLFCLTDVCKVLNISRSSDRGSSRCTEDSYFYKWR